MTGAILVLGAVAAVGAGSLLLASSLRPTTTATRLLLAYLIGWAQVSLLTLALSPLDALTRGGLVVAAAAAATIAVGVWALAGRPRALPRRSEVARALGELRDPVLAIPATASALVYGYLAVVATALPQSDSDPLVYQLTRAALWRQAGSVGIVGDGTDLRLDGNPIVAELADATLLTLAGSERFVWLGSFVATWALALGVFAIARRAGLDRRLAALSALLVPTLAIVELQAGTAQNDVVLASFVVAAVALGLERDRAAWVGLALAVALAVGTKFTGPLTLAPALVVLACAEPPRRWARKGAAVAVGLVLGSGWYVVNEVRTGDVSGGIASAAGQIPDRSPAATALRVQQLVLDAFDLSGLLGIWTGAYALAGVVVLALAVVLARRGDPGARGAAAVGLLLIALPLAAALARAGLRATFVGGWRLVGDGEAEASLARTISREPNGGDSWYGAMAVPLVLATLIVAARGVARRTQPGLRLALAAAPLIGLLVVAGAMVYDPWRGRFLIAPVAMSVAVWGLVTTRRPVAILVSAVATVSLVSCAATWSAKPFPYLGAGTGPAENAWRSERWEVQTLLRLSDASAPERAALRFVEEHVPSEATIALRLREDDYRFPAFGPTLSRTVVLLGDGDRPPDAATWAVTAPGLALAGCAAAWETRHAEGGWRIVTRRASDADACR